MSVGREQLEADLSRLKAIQQQLAGAQQSVEDALGVLAYEGVSGLDPQELGLRLAKIVFLSRRTDQCILLLRGLLEIHDDRGVVWQRLALAEESIVEIGLRLTVASKTLKPV